MCRLCPAEAQVMSCARATAAGLSLEEPQTRLSAGSERVFTFSARCVKMSLFRRREPR